MENRCFVVIFHNTTKLHVFAADKATDLLDAVTQEVGKLDESSKATARQLLEDPLKAFGRMATNNRPEVTLQGDKGGAHLILGYVGL